MDAAPSGNQVWAAMRAGKAPGDAVEAFLRPRSVLQMKLGSAVMCGITGSPVLKLPFYTPVSNNVHIKNVTFSRGVTGLTALLPPKKKKKKN